MTLRTRTLSIISATLAGLLALLFAASSSILSDSSAKMERLAAREQAQRTRAEVDSALESLDAVVQQWSNWDAMYEFASTGAAPLRHFLSDQALSVPHPDAVLILDRHGHIVFGSAYIPRLRRKVPLDPSVRAYFAGSSPFTPTNGVSVRRSGLVMFPDGPMLVAARPILPSTGTGTPRGTFIFASALRGSVLGRIRSNLGVPVTLERINSTGLPADFADAFKDLWPDRWWTYRDVSDHSLGVYVLLPDVQGQPVAMVRTEMDRAIHKTGLLSRRYLLATLVLAGVVFLLISLLVLERLVLRRLGRLSRDLAVISHLENPSMRVCAEGNDELGRLAHDVNVTLDALERAQAALHHQRQRESDERLASIVETNASGIVIFSAEGYITYANAAAERIYGVSRERLLGLRYDDERLYLPNGGPKHGAEHPFDLVMATGAPVFGVDSNVRHGDGGRVVLSSNASPLHDLSGAITGVVASISDVTERKALEERLAFQAYHDSLTSLPNRVLFRERLTRALVRSRRGGHSVGVLFVDLDNFKYINDSLGHATGDCLLVAVAERIQQCLRASDTAARFGGDEFTVLIDDMHGTDDAVIVAERLLQELKRPFLLGTREVFISLSVGIAHAKGRAGIQADELLRNADAAMYEAKARGKCRYEMYQARMKRHALHRLETESDLRRALERNELVVHYQPTVSLSTGCVAGFEALVRWHHPQRGIIAPVDFIPLAEETGLIVDVGRAVLRDSCSEALRWSKLKGAPENLSVGVNLSPCQVQHPDLVADVMAALQETGLRPDLLSLEITESAIIEDSKSVQDTLQALKAIGVRLIIDDFGTGYSSLSYLRRFPLHGLKIDRSFVEGLARDTEDRLIVSSTVDLAHGLGLKVVAEGAETIEQVNALRDLGCDLAQGYQFARPMPASDLPAYFAQCGALSRVSPLAGG